MDFLGGLWKGIKGIGSEIGKFVKEQVKEGVTYTTGDGRTRVDVGVFTWEKTSTGWKNLSTGETRLTKPQANAKPAQAAVVSGIQKNALIIIACAGVLWWAAKA